ncbi:MAG: PLD nuclease N-terminal domain-containing protein [Agromyces sp.]
MVRVWLALAAFAVVLTVFCAIDVLMLDRLRIRALPRWVWVLIVILIPVIGSVLWLAVGRARVPRTIAPDDDPAFLAELQKLLDDESKGTDPRD